MSQDAEDRGGTAPDVIRGNESLTTRISDVERRLMEAPWKTEASIELSDGDQLHFTRIKQGWGLIRVDADNHRGTLVRDLAIEAKAETLRSLPDLIRVMYETYENRRRLLAESNELLDQVDAMIERVAETGEGN